MKINEEKTSRSNDSKSEKVAEMELKVAEMEENADEKEEIAKQLEADLDECEGKALELKFWWKDKELVVGFGFFLFKIDFVVNKGFFFVLDCRRWNKMLHIFYKQLQFLGQAWSC